MAPTALSAPGLEQMVYELAPRHESESPRTAATSGRLLTRRCLAPLSERAKSCPVNAVKPSRRQQLPERAPSTMSDSASSSRKLRVMLLNLRDAHSGQVASQGEQRLGQLELVLLETRC
jgi:hypothetical protein